MNNIVETSVKNSEAAKQSKAIRLGKFQGVFAGFALGLFNTLKPVMSHKLAHKVCVDYMSDFARGIKENQEFASKVGKAKKADDSSTIKGRLEVARQINSNSMRIARIAQVCEDLYDEGAIAGRFFPDFSKLPDKVQEYLAEGEEWTAKQEWEE